MSAYLIRPDLSSHLFESEDSARQFIEAQASYKGIKFWYAANHDGKFRVYCDENIMVEQDDLERFPQPYKIILCDYLKN